MVLLDAEPHTHCEACEELVDLEENSMTWRFSHLKMVERLIGNQRGTGGSAPSGTRFPDRLRAGEREAAATRGGGPYRFFRCLRSLAMSDALPLQATDRTSAGARALCRA